MDCRGTKLLGFFAATFGLFATAWAAEDAHPIRALAWLSPDGQLEALSSEPSTDFRIDARFLTQSDIILAGEVLFHSPTLLGGQAAKAGISCASCHVNGRHNEQFQFPGVSGAPGTADVTHSFFSSHRGDGTFNPVPIPDLTKPGKISREKDGELEGFIHGLIVEEFDGAEPVPSALLAVTIYVRALCNDCESFPEPITLNTQWKRAERAITMAEKFQIREPDLARLLLSGARHQLGLVHERYADRMLFKERRELVDLSADTSKLQNLVGINEELYSKRSRALMRKIIRTKKILTKSAGNSLYNPALLEKSLVN